MEKLRLDKLVCDVYKITRSQAKKEIALGLIQVDGRVVKNSSQHFDTSVSLQRNGMAGNYQKYVYIMMNKPAGVLSATKDRKVKTAIDLLDEKMRQRDLFVAGRLDKYTTGFLLLTNDGDFAHRILSPNKHISKTYFAKLKKPAEASYIDSFASGIAFGDCKFKPARLDILSEKEVRIIIEEGKFHQIKRMFEAVGNEVLLLHREKMGHLALDPDLKSGQARYLTQQEVQKIGEKTE